MEIFAFGRAVTQDYPVCFTRDNARILLALCLPKVQTFFCHFLGAMSPLLARLLTGSCSIV